VLVAPYYGRGGPMVVDERGLIGGAFDYTDFAVEKLGGGTYKPLDVKCVTKADGWRLRVALAFPAFEGELAYGPPSLIFP